MFTRTLVAGAITTFFACSSAQAQITTIDGDTTGAPTFNRPSSLVALSDVGTAVSYQAVPFSVSPAGAVRLETIVGPTQFDTYLFLYSAFDPADGLANLIALNDDGGGAPCGSFSCSIINTALAPGDYVAVVSGFANGQVGIFQLEIEGPVLVAIINAGSAGDAGISATEIANMLTTAQTQSLRNIVRANHGARQAAGGGSMVQSMHGLSTTDFSVWAEIGGGRLDADFGNDLDASNFFGQAGIEAALNDSLAIGLGVGGAHSSADFGLSDIEGDALFVQPYVAYTANGLTAIGSLVYTHTDYDDATNTIDSGNRFAGSLFVGYDVPIAANTLATPFGYVAGGIEQFDTALGDETADFVTGRLGVELSRGFELLNTGTMHAFTSVAAEYVATGEPSLGAPALLSDYDDDRIGGRVEVGFDFTIAGTSTQFFGSVNGSGLFTDAQGIGGNAGIKIPF